MKLPTIAPSTEPKTKGISIRLTAEQATALKVHCNRIGQSTQVVVVDALAVAVPGFPA